MCLKNRAVTINYGEPGMMFFAGLFFAIFSIVIEMSWAEDWRRLDMAANVYSADAVAVDKENPRYIYIGSKEGVFKTGDSGLNWSPQGLGLIKDVNFLYIDERDSGIIYAATKRGLFRSMDAGENWQKIFTGKDILESDVLTIAVCYSSPKSIFIGTRQGIFFSPCARIYWQKVAGRLNDALIGAIIFKEEGCENALAASNKGLFKSANRFSSYQAVYRAPDFGEQDHVLDIETDEEEFSREDIFFKSLAVNPWNTEEIYAAGRDGVLISYDGGTTWGEKLFSGLGEKINHIFIMDQGRIFFAAYNGVFECSGDMCKKLYQGMSFNECSRLAADRAKNLYLAADKGVFVLPAAKKENAGEVLNELKTEADILEPLILDIQKEAVKYAEVSPEKISRWRRQARIKALAPQLTLDYDKTVTTALGASYDKVQVGPRDWGMTLKWDIGDLIFNSDQTSIDVRSRLMVQLRDDILNEVTRLYFERKRLRQELAWHTQDMSPKVKIDKELRLEELTASIDGLTGGYFSSRIKEAKSERRGN